MWKTVFDEIKTAYTADSPLDFFRASRPVGHNELNAALDLIGDYNAFCPEVVARALRNFAVTTVVAREGSVCLYLYPEKDENRKELKRALRYSAADEITDQADGSIRAWWD